MISDLSKSCIIFGGCSTKHFERQGCSENFSSGRCGGRKIFLGIFGAEILVFGTVRGGVSINILGVGQKNIKQYDSNSDIVHERVKNTMFVLKCPDAHNKGN